ncbi:hypothetical protein L9F63_023459, partial [Diploptera punctata]
MQIGIQFIIFNKTCFSFLYRHNLYRVEVTGNNSAENVADMELGTPPRYGNFTHKKCDRAGCTHAMNTRNVIGHAVINLVMKYQKDPQHARNVIDITRSLQKNPHSFSKMLIHKNSINSSSSGPVFVLKIASDSLIHSPLVSKDFHINVIKQPVSQNTNNSKNDSQINSKQNEVVKIKIFKFYPSLRSDRIYRKWANSILKKLL